MRKYISIIFGAFLLSLAACTEEIVDPNVVIGEGNRVILSLTSPGVNVTRSADTDVESALALIDVYIMDKDYNFVYTERIDNTASPVSGEGKFTLEKGRDEFGANKEYFVYIVANSTVEMADDWAELKSLTQKNSNVHLSGMNITSVASGDFPPKFFLMDGFAYVGNKEPENMSTLVINDSSTDDTVLKATLYRAAAKLIINITQGESVQFHQSLDGAGPLFSFYQLPISTLVVNPSLTAGRHVSEKQTTVEWGLSNNNFHWNTDKNGKPVLTLVGYAYANDWSGNNNAANETALLLSVPMTWDSNDDGTPDKDSPVNWYKVPVSKNEKLERNKCYVINVNINAVGAEEINVPLELKDIEYVTLDWQRIEVEIGKNEARYLTLNTDLVKIYDSNFDLDQLTFTSSSPIKSIKLKDVFSHNERMEGKSAFSALKLTKESDGTSEAEYETGDGVFAYYIDKFGQKIQLGTDPGFDISIVDNGYEDYTKEQIIALENNLYKKAELDPSQQYIRAEVPDEYKRALNGDIHIFSPINADGSDNVELNWNSHFNTVRYLEFEVMNEQGLTATFRVEQTPLTVITNEEGFYSFRDDHVLTDDPNEKPFDYFNYRSDFRSFMTSALSLIHPHDFTNEPKTEEWINTPQADRNYSTWFIKDYYDFTWLQRPNNDCPTQGTGDLMWIEHRYGFYDNAVSWNGGKNKGVFSGIYRAADGQRPYPNNHYFFRERYNGTGFGSMDTKGAAIGPYYEVEVEVEVDGVKQTQTRILRDHFIWQCFPIFWSKFVGEYYDKPEKSKYYSGQDRLKGQVDIHEYGPSEDGGKTWGRYRYSTNLSKYSNHRMYNILTTTTSEEYTIAYPRTNENGETENTLDNSKLVSPSIALASQLGETNHKQFKDYVAANVPSYIMPHIKDWYTIAKRQCDFYVETTYEDKNNNHHWDEGETITEYRDWRLPTKAEVDLILKYQANSRSMDEVLNAQYYFCITGTADSDDLDNIHNWVSGENKSYITGNEGYYVRCVRDVGRKN